MLVSVSTTSDKSRRTVLIELSAENSKKRFTFYSIKILQSKMYEIPFQAVTSCFHLGLTSIYQRVFITMDSKADVLKSVWKSIPCGHT